MTDLEERRSQSLQDVALVRRRFGEYVDPCSGCDLVPLPPRLVSEAMGVCQLTASIVLCLMSGPQYCISCLISFFGHMVFVCLQTIFHIQMSHCELN